MIWNSFQSLMLDADLVPNQKTFFFRTNGVASNEILALISIQGK